MQLHFAPRFSLGTTVRFPPRPPLAALLDGDGKRILTELGPSKLGMGSEPNLASEARLHDVEFRCSLWRFHQPTLPVAHRPFEDARVLGVSRRLQHNQPELTKARWGSQGLKRKFPRPPFERLLPQSACFLPRALGNARCRAKCVGVGGVLVQLGISEIAFGIAALCLGVFFKSAGTQAGPADAGLLGPSISVFGTIHPDIFRLPSASGITASGRRDTSGKPRPAGRLRAPREWVGEADRYFVVESTSLEERFAALNDHPSSFDERFGLSESRAGRRKLPLNHACPHD